jgi:radical SAM superfamily enzyme YgiQ (UPF0313 family)
MRVLFYYNGGEHIGVEYLSAYLKSKGHTVDLIFDPGLGSNFFLDLPFLNRFISDNLIVEKAKRFDPDIIAFSCITNHYSIIKNLAEKLKAEIDVPVIIGGVHPSSIPEEVIKEDCFDIVCIGEGEEAFEELLLKMEKKQSILGIENFWVKDENKKIHKNKLRPLIVDLDKLPLADKSIFYKYGALTSRIMVMTSRGCLFQCTYCVNSFIKNLYGSDKFLRRRSVDNVIEELLELKKLYKPKAFRFEDDVFAYDLKWLQEFREKYTEKINLPFHCYVTPTTARDPLLKELKSAGCTSVSMGVQSGNERIRKEILKRPHSNKTIIEAAERINNNGLKLISEFIFGFPTETPKEMWESLELNEKLNAYNTASFIFYPFPKTELADYCLEHNHLKEENYERIKRGEGSYHTSCFLEHPYEEEVLKFNSIFPIYNKSPKILKPLLRKTLKMKYGKIHRILYVFSIPLIDFDEFLIRIVQIPRMIIKTRKILNK